MMHLTSLILGDQVGKTSLVLSYVTNTFPDEPTLKMHDDNYSRYIETGTANTCTSEGKNVALNIRSYSDLELSKTIQPDVILLCFSVVDPLSYEHIRAKWSKIIHKYWPKIPVILVGLKMELRQDGEHILKLEQNGMVPVTREEGEYLAVKIGAKNYYETSALTQQGLKKLFELAMDVALQGLNERKSANSNKKKHEKCMIM